MFLNCNRKIRHQPFLLFQQAENKMESQTIKYIKNIEKGKDFAAYMIPKIVQK